MVGAAAATATWRRNGRRNKTTTVERRRERKAALCLLPLWLGRGKAVWRQSRNGSKLAIVLRFIFPLVVVLLLLLLFPRSSSLARVFLSRSLARVSWRLMALRVLARNVVSRGVRVACSCEVLRALGFARLRQLATHPTDSPLCVSLSLSLSRCRLVALARRCRWALVCHGVAFTACV